MRTNPNPLTRGRITHLRNAGALYSEIAQAFGVSENEVMVVEKNQPRPPDPRIEQPRCPKHLVKMAQRWREKHGDALVVEA